MVTHIKSMDADGYKHSYEVFYEKSVRFNLY